MNDAFLCLGGNLGDRQGNLDKARVLITERCGKINAVSKIYETEAWESHSLNKYLNQVIRIKTGLNENKLLKRLLEIEKELGRERKGKKNEDRLIDIDILFFNNSIVEMKGLVIPHPRLHLRRFVLKPLMDIDRKFVHPFLKESIEKLYAKCADKSQIREFRSIRYICIEGNIGSGKSTLARVLADRLKGAYLPEQFEKNDLLPLFYSDPKEFAFPLEYSFLLGRYQQIYDAFKSGADCIVSDYSFYKCLWFATLNLKGRDLKFFKKHFSSLEKQLPKPDLIVYLKTPVDNLLKNISSRGRTYESGITKSYLKQIKHEYEKGINKIQSADVIEIPIKTYHRRLQASMLKIIHRHLRKAVK
jgi:2-amino-4-hydroxy-6-hydroxymethyldihydropteridine diphosphokinase